MREEPLYSTTVYGSPHLTVGKAPLYKTVKNHDKIRLSTTALIILMVRRVYIKREEPL